MSRKVGSWIVTSPRGRVVELYERRNAARALPIAPIMRPLRNHLLRLAANDAKHGYCQGAGSLVARARAMAEKFPTTADYNEAVIQAHARRDKRGRRRR